MNQPPLNPDALEAVAHERYEARRSFEGLPHWEDLLERNRKAEIEALGNIVSAYLAVAQPVVTMFEESDALPVGSVVFDVDGNTARRFPDGWRTTVVEADGRVWLSGHMEDPDLPARVLYRPEVKP